MPYMVCHLPSYTPVLLAYIPYMDPMGPGLNCFPSLPNCETALLRPVAQSLVPTSSHLAGRDGVLG